MSATKSDKSSGNAHERSRTYIVLPVEDGPTVLAVEDADATEPLQRAVGGYFEAVGIPGSAAFMMCDEDGRAKSKPTNLRASLLAGRQIVGDVILMGKADDEGVPGSFSIDQLLDLAELRGVPSHHFGR